MEVLKPQHEDLLIGELGAQCRTARVELAVLDECGKRTEGFGQAERGVVPVPGRAVMELPEARLDAPHGVPAQEDHPHTWIMSANLPS